MYTRRIFYNAGYNIPSSATRACRTIGEDLEVCPGLIKKVVLGDLAGAPLFEVLEVVSRLIGDAVFLFGISKGLVCTVWGGRL